MSQAVAGTFCTTTTAFTGQISDVLPIPSSPPTMKLSLSGVDASNTVRTEKRTTPGGAWATQVTYNSNQSATPVTVVAGEEWRLVTVLAQTMKSIAYKMSLES